MDGISRIIILQLIAVVSWSEIDLSLFEKPLFHLLVKTQPKHSHRLSSRYRFLVEFPSFWNTRYFTWNTYLVFQIQCAKNLVFQTFSFEIPSFFYPNAMFLIEILGFSLEILGISKISDNLTSYMWDWNYVKYDVFLQTCISTDAWPTYLEQ